MVKSKKAPARAKSPPPSSEVTKKKQLSKTRTPSRARKPSQARSKSRSRKATASKVRGRSRSRSRSISRSKSPKRKTRPRSRPRSRSRSRSVKSTPTMRTRARSRSRKDVTDVVSPKLPFETKVGDYTVGDTKLNEIIRRSISRELSQEKVNSYRMTRSTVLANLKEKDAKNIDGLGSDSQKQKLLPQRKLFFSFSLPQWFKDLFQLVVPPLVVVFLHLACRYNSCHLNKFSIPQNWRRYLSYEAGGILSGFILVQAILSLLPIGKIVGGPSGVNGSLNYRCNGLLVTFLTVGIVAGLWHFQYPITIVYDKLIPLLISSIIFSYVFGFILFIKGGKAPIPALNPESIVGSTFHQFFVGREVNPLLFGKINVKVLLMRTCFNGMLLLNGILALKSYSTKQELSYPLAACLIINAVMVMDLFWFESSFPSTFQAMYEGAGCWLTLKYMLYPFLPILITKCIVLHKIELPVWGLVAVAAGIVLGFFFHRASNLQKAAFRQCPLNPALMSLETIPTSRGKKLLVSGLWGWVRHPNYLGFIILHWAWASASGYNHVVPYLVPWIVTLMMMLRARCVDAFCHSRYQSAWEEYCSRVRHRIFRHVY